MRFHRLRRWETSCPPRGRAPRCPVTRGHPAYPSPTAPPRPPSTTRAPGHRSYLTTTSVAPGPGPSRDPPSSTSSCRSSSTSITTPHPPTRLSSRLTSRPSTLCSRTQSSCRTSTSRQTNTSLLPTHCPPTNPTTISITSSYRLRNHRASTNTGTTSSRSKVTWMICRTWVTFWSLTAPQSQTPRK